MNRSLLMSQAIHRLMLSHPLLQSQTTAGTLRLYSRWKSRDPAKVLLPFEAGTKPSLKKEKVIDLDPDVLKKTKEKYADDKIANKSFLSDEPDETISPNATKPEVSFFPREKAAEIKTKRDQALKRREFFLKQKKVFDSNKEIIYEKLKENDGRLSTLLVKLKSKKERLRSGQVLVEGWRLIVDGLEAKCKLKYLVFSRTEDLENIRPFLPKTGVLLYKIPYKEIQLWSDVETSPGIFGVFAMPTPENVKRLSKPLPLNLICDNIRVPGNLGAILRVAVGVGCDKVILTKGCVDLWDPKVIRSAAGAHFRLPVYNSIDWENIDKHLDKDTSLFIADSNAEVVDEADTTKDSIVALEMPVLPYYGVQYNSYNQITLIIGGETEGISEESYALAAQHNGLRLNIPLQRGVDSLNTGMATAVIAFEIRKQLIEAWSKARIERHAVHVT